MAVGQGRGPVVMWKTTSEPQCKSPPSVKVVMTSSAQLGKEEREKQNPMEIKANVLLRFLVLVIKTP